MGCGIILPNQYKLERGEGEREGRLCCDIAL